MKLHDLCCAGQSDIDLVAVCCNHVCPEDFFDSLPAIFYEKPQVCAWAEEIT